VLSCHGVERNVWSGNIGGGGCRWSVAYLNDAIPLSPSTPRLTQVVGHVHSSHIKMICPADDTDL